MSHIAVLPPISSGDCGMHDRDRKLLSRARRAYECGRLIVALRAAFVALALVGLAVVLGAPNTVTLLAGGALVLATGFCAFYGERSEAPPTSYCWVVLRPSSGYW